MTKGPTQLSIGSKEIEDHGTEYHAEGFGSPLGRVCHLMKPLEQATEYELQQLGIFRDEQVQLEFLFGVTVNGHLQQIHKHDNRIIMMSFENCTVLGPPAMCYSHLIGVFLI